ncbi:hypothetical protein ACSTS3_13320 [Aquimarina muelleri]|uniref:hypothetical protein n=1 Tax=Aquimarina muelleri TaxID=279356 RepID=UPI003F682D79
MVNSRKSEVALLEQYRIVLEGAKNQPQIVSEMEKLNYDTNKITEGQELLLQARRAYNFSKQEDKKTIKVSEVFKKEKEILNKQFKKHRKKAKTIFRKNPEILKKLGIDSIVPYVYINWIENTRKFYKEIDFGIQQRLILLKITERDVADSLVQVEKVEMARAEYLREKGKLQNANKQKRAAIVKVTDWMLEFYFIAEIALEDHPKLVEALGGKRKS